MSKPIWTRYAPLVALVLLALLAGVAAAMTSPEHARTDAAVLQRGEYLVRAGDCAACHTADTGKPFAGGRAVPTPFGNVFAPNITPDMETGIGGWTASDFRAAMHDGRRPDGRLLYPAFPFTSYTRISDDDVDAMYAWLSTQPPVQRHNTPTDLHFPFNLRRLLLAWRTLYFTPGRYKPDARKSAQWNRGAYLVQGVGHCTECHTPRNFLGASRSDQRLGGALIPQQNWYAPDLRVGPDGGLAGWQKQDIVDLLKTGRSRHGSAFGPMADVVQNSLQYMTKADLEAMAEYLVDVPSQPDAHEPSTVTAPAHVPGQAALLAIGQQVYSDHCAACHGSEGRGVAHVYPPLAGNTSLLADDPVNAVRMVLLGGFEVTTQTYPRPYSMPSYMQKLDDHEVAAVVTWLRQSWGNHAGAVSPQSVRKYRTLPLQ